MNYSMGRINITKLIPDTCGLITFSSKICEICLAPTIIAIPSMVFKRFVAAQITRMDHERYIETRLVTFRLLTAARRIQTKLREKKDDRHRTTFLLQRYEYRR